MFTTTHDHKHQTYIWLYTKRHLCEQFCTQNHRVCECVPMPTCDGTQQCHTCVFPSWCDSWHAFCHPKMAMWWSGNVCLHTGWSCLIAQLLCHSAIIWWHGHTCLHTYYVPVLPCGGLGMPVCLHVFQVQMPPYFSLRTPVYYLLCSSANNWRAGHNFECLLCTSSGLW